MTFFTLQLFFGEAGIIAFIQKKSSTDTYYENITELIEINNYLKKQVKLNKTNESYLMMNAHRVGLLAEGEYLIKLDTPISFNSIVYSPGKIILKKKMIYISNIALFIMSLILCALIISARFIRGSFLGSTDLSHMSNNEYNESNSQGIPVQRRKKSFKIINLKNKRVQKETEIKDINKEENDEQWNYTRRHHKDDVFSDDYSSNLDEHYTNTQHEPLTFASKQGV